MGRPLRGTARYREHTDSLSCSTARPLADGRLGAHQVGRIFVTQNTERFVELAWPLHVTGGVLSMQCRVALLPEVWPVPGKVCSLTVGTWQEGSALGVRHVPASYVRPDAVYLTGEGVGKSNA